MIIPTVPKLHYIFILLNKRKNEIDKDLLKAWKFDPLSCQGERKILLERDLIVEILLDLNEKPKHEKLAI